MKRLLQLGFALGLVGTIAAAYFAPWIDYTRYRTSSSVLANGGRVEQFTVHLPADRIGDPIEASDPAATDGAAKTRLEHFRLRDENGNVIGIVARHQLAVADGDSTAWLLTIPSRGTIALAANSLQARSIDQVLAASGLEPGQSADAELSIDLGAAARSVASTGEFAGLAFELVETWIVTGLEPDGGVRGSLRLSTIAMAPT